MKRVNHIMAASIGALGLFVQGCILDDRGPLIVDLDSPTPYALEIPSNLPPITLPDDNPLTVEGVALGRKLFYEELLSGDNTQSCGSCHAQAFAFSDNGRQFSQGIDGQVGDKNAMAIMNLAWTGEFFWDGRAVGIENQALQPVENPIEMHESWPNAVAELQASSVYPALFKKAFGEEMITPELVAKAIAQFERTLISGNSEYDKYYRGEPNNFSQAAFRGLTVFMTERGDCFHCHTEDLFSVYQYHNNGLDDVFTTANLGREAVTGRSSDRGKFKVPTLRNCEKTGPYMHDGRFNTLEEVVEHYNSGIKRSPTLSPSIKKPDGLFLTEQEKSDLVVFLKSLTDQDFLTNPDFSDPD